VGARVTRVEIGNAKDGFKPLDPNATYRIVTNDFMANGGDGYAVFKNGKNVYGGDVPMDQALADYLKYLNAPISPRVEGRIVLTGTPPPAPTATPTRAASPAVATATPTLTPTPTPTLFRLPMWTPLPYPTFSFEPVLPRLRVPCQDCRPADPPERGRRDPTERWD
jgi:5'-nucleotidase/UDP-sugar diphosphatase